jgi:enoyl-CoA hydratase/carnithine racemase
MLTSRRFDAAEAERIGLISRVVPTRGLGDVANTIIDALLAAPPLSLSLTKQGMWLALRFRRWTRRSNWRIGSGC